MKYLTGVLLITLLASTQAAEPPKDICKPDEKTQRTTEENIKKQCAPAADPTDCERQAWGFYDALVGIHCPRTPKERK